MKADHVRGGVAG